MLAIKNKIKQNFPNKKLVYTRGEDFTYELIRESGPDHNKEFVVQVCVNGNSVGEGIGSSKKRAEQAAARAAFAVLGAEGEK